MILCWFFHRWGKWIDGDVNFPTRTVGGQVRRCARCNKVKWRVVDFF